MKKMIVAMVFIAFTSSMRAMYKRVPLGKKLLDSEQLKNNAIRDFLNSPVKAGPKELRDIVVKYNNVIQELDLIHARDENGWNIVHHLAAKGAKYGEENLEFMLNEYRVSPRGVLLSNATRSPSLDEVMKRYDNGEYGNCLEVSLSQSSVQRKLDFTKDVEPGVESAVSTALSINQPVGEDKGSVVAEDPEHNQNEDGNDSHFKLVATIKDVESGRELGDKSKIGKEELSLVRYTFWAVVSVIVADLLYKKYGTYDKRKQVISLIPGR